MSDRQKQEESANTRLPFIVRPIPPLSVSDARRTISIESASARMTIFRRISAHPVGVKLNYRASADNQSAQSRRTRGDLDQISAGNWVAVIRLDIRRRLKRRGGGGGRWPEMSEARKAPLFLSLVESRRYPLVDSPKRIEIRTSCNVSYTRLDSIPLAFFFVFFFFPSLDLFYRYVVNLRRNDSRWPKIASRRDFRRSFSHLRSPRDICRVLCIPYNQCEFIE